MKLKNDKLRKIILKDKIVKKIIKIIKKELFINFRMLESKSRKREIVDARHICHYFIKQQTRYSLSKIGLIFNRDHCAVRNSIIKTNELKETSHIFRTIFLKVENEIIIENQTRFRMFKKVLKKTTMTKKEIEKEIKKYLNAS